MCTIKRLKPTNTEQRHFNLMTERFNGLLWCKQQSKVTDVLEKLCEVDKCVSQIDLRKRRAKQALITDNVLGCIHNTVCYRWHFFHFTSIHINMQIISTYSFLSGGYLHNWLIHVHAIYSSTYMYMKNVNDVTGWLSQTTDISKYFVWSPGLRDKESRLYLPLSDEKLAPIDLL